MELETIIISCFLGLVGVLLYILYLRDDSMNDSINKRINELDQKQDACKKDLWMAIASIRETYTPEKVFNDHRENCPIGIAVENKSDAYTKFFSLLEIGLKELNDNVKALKSELRSDIANFMKTVRDEVKSIDNKLDYHILKTKDE